MLLTLHCFGIVFSCFCVSIEITTSNIETLKAKNELKNYLKLAGQKITPYHDNMTNYNKKKIPATKLQRGTRSIAV